MNVMRVFELCAPAPFRETRDRRSVFTCNFC